MKRRILLIALFLLAAVSLNNAQPVDALISEGKKLLYKADVEFDLTSYIKARGMFERVLASEKENYLANYFSNKVYSHSLQRHSVLYLLRAIDITGKQLMTCPNPHGLRHTHLWYKYILSFLVYCIPEQSH